MNDEQTVNIDGKDYKVSDLSKDQVKYVNHVADLDRQLAQLGMSAEQAQVSRKHFMGLLSESLKKAPADGE
tara:strand:- start:23 stop:235 length:213 start_codon:yes stop_codon:yes gene_type:complete